MRLSSLTDIVVAPETAMLQEAKAPLAGLVFAPNKTKAFVPVVTVTEVTVDKSV
jgi:hypothetical protein